LSQIKVNDTLNAFCKDSDAYLEGVADGPLSGLTFAAKDIFDVAGYVTGGGNPDWKATHDPAERTAWCVDSLIQAGATMVGKTITDELTRGIFGENAHYGTPVNPRAPDRVPGGSSSGSVAAAAGGLVDFALGSDTGGSVRVPSSFCGVYGLRPTHGRIPLDGILLQAPSYDTIGWFARDVNTFARVSEILLQRKSADTAIRRLVIAEDAFALADDPVTKALQPALDIVSSIAGESRSEKLSSTSLMDWSVQQGVLQMREAWETAKDWIDSVNPRFAMYVAEGYSLGRSITDADVEEAQAARGKIVSRMELLLSDGTFVCLPTTVSPAPLKGERMSERLDVRSRNTALTCIAGTIGAPQISLPLGEVDGLPVGLSIIGARGSDEALIKFAADIAESMAS
jgi:amidase